MQVGRRVYRTSLGCFRRPTFTALFQTLPRSTAPWRCASSTPGTMQPSSPLLRNTLMLRCTGVDAATGELETYAQFYEKNVICNQFGLQHRDLRKLDPSFVNQLPVVLARNKAILVSMEHIHALIRHDKVLIFSSPETVPSVDVHTFIADVQNALAEQNSGVLNVGAMRLAPEFIALEAALQNVMQKLMSDAETLFPSIETHLTKLELSADREAVFLLLRMTRDLTQLSARAKNIMTALTDVLANDDDMAQMYLTYQHETGKVRPITEHQEIELLLESYLKQAEEVIARSKELVANVRATEDIVQLALASFRTEMHFFEQKVSSATFSLTAATLLTSVFGMNLLTGVEHVNGVFMLVAGSSIIIAGLCMRRCLSILRTLRDVSFIRRQIPWAHHAQRRSLTPPSDPPS